MVADLNFLAIAAITVLTFGLGFLWYGPLFGTEWQKLIGLHKRDMKHGMARHLIQGLIGMFVLISGLALIIRLNGLRSWQDGALMGLILGGSIVLPVLYSEVNWEKRPAWLFFINGLYWLVTLMLAGGLYVVWIY